MKTKFVLLAILAITLMSCNDSKKSNSDSSETNTEIGSETEATLAAESIENTQWVITKLGGQDMMANDTNNKEIYFTLDSKTNRVNGNSGCNTFMGSYKLDKGNRITFTEMASTKMACPDSDINESQVLNVFNTVDNFTINDGKLALNKAKRAALAEFKKSENSNETIVETKWKLKTLNGRDITKVDNQEQDITFTLSKEDNRVSGFAGCNGFGGDYTLEEGNRISFKGMIATLKACPDVDFNESEFLKVFELADNYTIKNSILSLNIAKRAPVAIFEAVDLN